MDNLKTACDGLSACAAFAAFLGAMPTILGTIAALLSIIWYLIRIYSWMREQNSEL